jgi:hypothetical protein
LDSNFINLVKNETHNLLAFYNNFDENWRNIRFSCPYPTRISHFNEALNFFAYLVTGRKELFLSLISFIACLIFDTLKKQIVYFYGEMGNNGKSKLMCIIQDLFERSSVTLKRSTIYSEAETEPRPDLEKCKHAIVCALDETYRRKQMNTTSLKSIVSESRFYERTLYSPGGTINIDICMLLAGNHLPNVDPDPALGNRFSIVPFDTCFIKNLKTEDAWQTMLDTKRAPMHKIENAHMLEGMFALAWGYAAWIQSRGEPLQFTWTDDMRHLHSQVFPPQ